MEKKNIREQLEAMGCIIEGETKDRIIVVCPKNLLEGGLKVEGVESVETKGSDEKNVVLEFKKSEE
ncbi:MAG: hypothetical protein ACTSWZ_07705 [Candidatus Heimdallarchaeaceae archaeon]